MSSLFITHPDCHAPGIVYGFGVRGDEAFFSDAMQFQDSSACRRRYGRAIMEAHGPAVQEVLHVTQVHGDTSLLVTDPAAHHQDTQADALVTTLPGVALAVATADCLPLVLFSRQKVAVAAVHAGWRGALAGVLTSAIALMHRKLGVEPADLHLVMGPCIGPDAYEVDEDLARRFTDAFGPAARGRTAHGTPSLDLKAANRRLALAAGIPREQIHCLDLCTFGRGDLFFSHRRQQGKAGRMLNFVAITDPKAAALPMDTIDLDARE